MTTPTQAQIEAERAVGFREGVEWAKANLTAAAETTPTQAQIEGARKSTAATIERCAQRIGDRALQYDLQNNQEHALWNECMENIAAIRALKDKP